MPRGLLRGAASWHGSGPLLPRSSSRFLALGRPPCGCTRRLATTAEQQAELLAGVEDIPPSRIRNFCIISHVDHGKSTLADRLMDMTGAVPSGQSRAQLLDSLEVERSRGITVKAQTVSLFHRDEESGEQYLLNLIDTPGHVDFSYEVSRSIAACQGALLLVDCTKGVQAQTVANFWLAFEQDLAILPIVNKVDLPHADVPGALEQMATAFDTEADDALCISAKTGQARGAAAHTSAGAAPQPSATTCSSSSPCTSGSHSSPAFVLSGHRRAAASCAGASAGARRGVGRAAARAAL